MKVQPSLEECKQLMEKECVGVIPISTEIYADTCTPVEVLRILKHVSSHVYLLESAEADKRWGRYSFLGYDPLLEITGYNGTVTIKTPLTTQTTREDIRSRIRSIIEENKSPKFDYLPSFTGGLVGYFSYDYIKYSEPTLQLDAEEGDIFQVVLSNRLEAEMEGSLLDAYRVLRTLNPSPYMFYFSGSDGEIAGASPETLVKLEQDKLYTFPLAGTRPRGATPAEDARLEKELLADEKERAEHNMLVDLGRNDIGKISRIGTVSVEKYMSIEPDVRVIRNDELTVEEIEALAPTHIILSPGPGKPSDAGICEDVIRAFGGKVPILGICLGHQAICEVFGATVTYAKQLMHGKQSVAKLDTDSVLFRGMEQEITVARYHSLAADPDTMPDCLRVTANTCDGEVMAVEHTEYPVYGVQFHPESVLTPEGRQIMENFLRAGDLK